MNAQAPSMSPGDPAARPALLLRGARVVTMDPALGEFAQADVLVRDGRIAAVGPGLPVAADARVIDASAMLLMPGLVDTHWHMWTSLLRGYTNHTPQRSYISVRNRLGHHVTPEDVHACVRLSLAEALSAGITTVHNWAHNMNTPAHADATVQAHRDVPLRARFSYGAPHWLAADETMDLADVSRVRDTHFASGDRLLHMGVAMRGPEFDGCTPAVWRREWAHARSLGLPITVHVAEYFDSERWQAISKLARDGLLGPDVQLVHAVHASVEERAMIRDSGSHVSITPTVEAIAGMGLPAIQEFLDDGVLLGLSIDVTAASNPADLFSLMRTTMALQRYRGYQRAGYNATDPTLKARVGGLSSRKLVEMATIDGARCLGLDDITGSITPGKRADLILLRTDDLNLNPSREADPFQLLVYFAQPSNVDTVIVDGRVLKQGGRLTGIDAAQVSRACAGALDGLLARTTG